jgi:protein-S-isoprenylcysteine O-methyltransferase Ste14
VTKPFVSTHHAAGLLLAASVVLSLLVESLATYAGQARTSDARGRARALLGLRAIFEATTGRSGGSTADRGTKQILIAGMIGAIALGWLAAVHVPSADLPGNGWAYVATGVATIWLGVFIRGWAVLTLGRWFRREVHVEAGQQVVRTGPYRYIRHPAYLGNLLATLGVGIALVNWLSITVLVVVPYLAHLPRIHVEERALKNQLGAPYEEYAATTKRLIPGVW